MGKFKKGDKVRVIKDTSDPVFPVGAIFKIESISKSKEGSSLLRKSNGFGDYLYEDEVELVEDKTQVNYILLDGSITLSFDAQIVSISEGDHRYSAIIEAVRGGNLELIPDLVDVSKSFSNIEGVELVDGRIKLNGKSIPEVVSDRVLRFKEQNLPFDPLIKFAEKLLKNPSFNSRKMLYKFLEHNGHPITKDGNFIAYKKVDSEFKDCYTHKMDNSVGTTVEMDRDEVDDNPDNTCSSGLHVAAYDYANTFRNGHLVEVEIDPEDVVAVPNDYNGEKMRVCKYKVVAVCESRLDDVELYDDDEYDETDH